MKNFLVGLLLITTVAFAVLYVRQNEKMHKTEAELTALKNELTDLQSQLSQRNSEATGLRERLLDARAPIVQAAEPTVAIVTNTVSAPEKTNGMRSAFAGMFKSPEMRDMIKNQQKAMFGTIIDKSYADFFTSMNMTSEQSAALKDLMAKKMLVDADAGMQMLSGDLDAAKRAELTEQNKSEKAAIDAEIKNFLGADNYTQYQAYEKTVPDRTMIGQFRDQLTGDSAMSTAQEQQLMQAMSEERTGFKFSTDYNDRSKFDGDFENAFSEERMNKFFEESEQLSQRYLNRAQNILLPAQIQAYQKFLATQREMQKAGMKMAQSMFAPKSK